jgi:hypothetical protein
VVEPPARMERFMHFPYTNQQSYITRQFGSL